MYQEYEKANAFSIQQQIADFAVASLKLSTLALRQLRLHANVRRNRKGRSKKKPLNIN